MGSVGNVMEALFVGLLLLDEKLVNNVCLTEMIHIIVLVFCRRLHG